MKFTLKDVITSSKTAIAVSAWRNGEIPYSQFPLSISGRKALKYGPQYEWCLINFECIGHKFVTLISINIEKQIYRARLACRKDDDMRVLCDHEFHAGEDGWHCHFYNGECENLKPGVRRDKNLLRRWPASPKSRSRRVFDVSKLTAVGRAVGRFRIRDGEGLF